MGSPGCCPGLMPMLPPALIRAVERGGSDLSLLVIRLGALGDIIRTLPPVRLLRAGLPEARIRWVVEDRFESVLRGHPDLDGTVVLPRKDLDIG